MLVPSPLFLCPLFSYRLPETVTLCVLETTCRRPTPQATPAGLEVVPSMCHVRHCENRQIRGDYSDKLDGADGKDREGLHQAGHGVEEGISTFGS
jgi:hypothetical protein